MSSPSLSGSLMYLEIVESHIRTNSFTRRMQLDEEDRRTERFLISKSAKGSRRQTDLAPRLATARGRSVIRQPKEEVRQKLQKELYQ